MSGGDSRKDVCADCGAILIVTLGALATRLSELRSRLKLMTADYDPDVEPDDGYRIAHAALGDEFAFLESLRGELERLC